MRTSPGEMSAVRQSCSRPAVSSRRPRDLDRHAAEAAAFAQADLGGGEAARGGGEIELLGSVAHGIINALFTVNFCLSFDGGAGLGAGRGGRAKVPPTKRGTETWRRSRAAIAFDYVIVGAGSAGCVLANRLSEDPNVTVALLEAGGHNDSLLVNMPAGVGQLIANKNAMNWGFETTPQAHLDGRRFYQPRGRGWGGSSAINGMIYIRGHARDYDQWRQMGLTGWGYADVLPYFKRAQNQRRRRRCLERRRRAAVCFARAAGRSDLQRRSSKRGAQAGYPVTRDFNGYQQEGAGPYHLTIRTANAGARRLRICARSLACGRT